MRWQIHHDCTKDSSDTIIDVIMDHRGFTDPTAINSFLSPPPPQSYAFADVGLAVTSLDHAVDLLQTAVANQTPIIVYGDYDADGITATAILWETLHHLGAKAVPFIPSRELHGYGLSIAGLTDALRLVETQPLIITVDNGIVAHEAAAWLATQTIPLIITDHHTVGATTPSAVEIVHSTQISGAGVAWFLANRLSAAQAKAALELAGIGTIADMMPLTGINRSFAKFGLEALAKTTRPGLIQLLKQADINSNQKLSPYHVNYIIAPRLNAMGRLEHALDSLRLLCTTNPNRAETLALKLTDTNRTRQDLTLDLLARAAGQVNAQSLDPVIIVDDEEFHEGIIGLIAGKLVESFYRPSIVISRKAGISKASARSIKGVNITELIRSQSELLLGAGGHPMAAGFSIETAKIELFKQGLLEYAGRTLDVQVFEPVLDIDCAISESAITPELYQAIQKLEPFGIGNKEPIFAIQNADVISTQTIGKNGNHKKIRIRNGKDLPLDALWFNAPESSDQIQSGSIVDLAGTLSLNTWKNKSFLQLIIKDLHHL